MKGIVFTEFLELVEMEFGLEVVQQIIDECEELFIDYGEEYWNYARKQNIRPEGRQRLITEYFI